MFIKSDIRRITIALEKAFYSEVYLALGKAGIIHLARFSERDSLGDTGLHEEETLAGEIISGTEYNLNALAITPEESGISALTVDKNQDAALVFELKKIIERAMRLRTKIREKENITARQMEYAEVLNRMSVESAVIKKARLVKIIFGTVENAIGDISSDSRFILNMIDNYVLGICLPSDYPALFQFLKNYGFTDKSDEVNPLPLKMIKRRLEILQRRGEIVDTYLNQLKKEKGQMLKVAKQFLPLL